MLMMAVTDLVLEQFRTYFILGNKIYLHLKSLIVIESIATSTFSYSELLEGSAKLET